MFLDVAPIINATEIGSFLWQNFQTSISPLISIFKAIGIAILVYIVFLIIRALFKWRAMNKIGKIEKNVEQINSKLDILIGNSRKSDEIKSNQSEKIQEKKFKKDKIKNKKKEKNKKK